LDGELLHGIGQNVESVGTGSALSGPFAFEVPDHPTDLEQGTDVGGKERHNARPDRRAKIAGRLLGQRHGHRLVRCNPTTAIAAKEHPSDRPRGIGPETQDVTEPYTERSLDDPGFGPASGNGEESGAGRPLGPDPAEPVGTEPSYKRCMGE
jgi:hypothetical protein